jgi:excinuclease ABC subunit A
LDEPTTGLHFEDVKKLLKILNTLTKLGNTVVVIEHNLDVIASADWVIDLGPEGGSDGGQLIIEGPPEKIINYDDISHTAKFLKKKILNSKLIEVNN